MSRELAQRLVDQRPFIESLIRREASGLLRFEAAEDLVQGVMLRALGSGSAFHDHGEPAFLGWLTTLARRHVADRNDHWKALRRGSGRVMRLTASGTTDPWNELSPGTQTGPATFASRREQLVLITRALDLLPPRDRDLVRWMSEGLTLAQRSERLG
ncbi:MAG: hypothetical protein KDB53_03715, partial [Planctomycetes bacterium]|nr:hypothetical protein [Planctomycetota bacterium]